ncbi:hypothetical protein PENTCL1PPCAC_4278, partial [Pristionchus entomophagus]
MTWQGSGAPRVLQGVRAGQRVGDAIRSIQISISDWFPRAYTSIHHGSSALRNGQTRGHCVLRVGRAVLSLVGEGGGGGRDGQWVLRGGEGLLRVLSRAAGERQVVVAGCSLLHERRLQLDDLLGEEIHLGDKVVLRAMHLPQRLVHVRVKLAHIQEGVALLLKFALVPLDATELVDRVEETALMMPEPQIIALVQHLLVLVDEPSLLQHTCCRVLPLIRQLRVGHEVVHVLFGAAQLQLSGDHRDEGGRNSSSLKKS